MSIPVLMSRILPSATDTVQVSSGGTLQSLSTTTYYFLTNNTSSGNGSSFLFALGAALVTSAGGGTFDVFLTSDLKVKFEHNAAGARTITMDRHLAWMLGFDTGLAHVAGTSFTTPSIPTGLTGYTVPYRSAWLWCPEMHVSSTGPELFDPTLESGIMTSAGTVTRAPDGTTMVTAVGTQVEAVFMFHGVEGFYRARRDYLPTNTRQREDFETFWRYGLRIQKSFLYWRNKTDVLGTNLPQAFTFDGANKYIEYAPQPQLRAAPLIKSVAGGTGLNRYFWDIEIPCWLTERGETAYS